MNAKHQFKYTYNDTTLEEYSPLEVTFDMPGDVTINQMLWNFECYLKACGFIFDGKLEIVDEDYIGSVDEDWTNNDTSCCNNDEVDEWNRRLEALEEKVKKEKWVHGICNPPSPDWKKNK